MSAASSEVQEHEGTKVVVLAGEIDLQTSWDVRRVLMEQVDQKCPLVVDLAAVDYIDSSGIAGLVEAFQVARKAETGFVLADVSDAVMRVLHLARLDKVLPMAENRDAALAQLG